MGTKNVAPPTPDAIATVAMQIEIGNINQLSNVIFGGLVQVKERIVKGKRLISLAVSNQTVETQSLLN